MTEYNPGECNIDAEEKRNRAIIGASGLVTAALMAGVIIQQGLPDYVLLFAFIPLLLGFEGVFQALNSFCVHFAHKGVYNDGDGLKEVGDKNAHEKDEKEAKRIHGMSIAASATVTVVLYVVLMML